MGGCTGGEKAESEGEGLDEKELTEEQCFTSAP